MLLNPPVIVEPVRQMEAPEARVAEVVPVYVQPVNWVLPLLLVKLITCQALSDAQTAH